MKEYEFRTTRPDMFVSQIYRHEHHPSGLIIPTGIAQITYADNMPVVSSELHIPSAEETIAIGLTTEIAHESTSLAIDRFTFSEKDLRVFGQKALVTCAGILREYEPTNVYLLFNRAAVNDTEAEIVQALSDELVKIANETNGVEEAAASDVLASPEPLTGMYL